MLDCREVPVRASDYRTLLTCPFLYFLKVRCGIKSATGSVGALMEGSLFHTAMESLIKEGRPDFPIQDIRTSIIDRAITCDTNPEPFLNDLEDSYRHTQIWASMAADFMPKGIQILATEYFIRDQFLSRAIRLDLLTLEEDKLWIWDYKTTSILPSIRCASAAYEFQTQLYCDTIERLLDFLKEEFALPSETTLGGFKYLYVQKPTIRIRKTDIKKEGIIGAKDIYRKRCEDWYKGRNEFKHLDREYEPALYLHTIPYNKVDYRDFSSRLDLMLDHATMPYAKCIRLPRSDHLIYDTHSAKGPTGLSIYAPFYIRPEEEWDAILNREPLIVDFRDDETTADLEV